MGKSSSFLTTKSIYTVIVLIRSARLAMPYVRGESLRQGRWHAMEQTVTTCEGQTIKPDLDSQAIAHIERRQSRSSVDVSVAWLEAPEGSQLLLVANSDFCRWQPNEKTF